MKGGDRVEIRMFHIEMHTRDYPPTLGADVKFCLKAEWTSNDVGRDPPKNVFREGLGFFLDLLSDE